MFLYRELLPLLLILITHSPNQTQFTMKKTLLTSVASCLALFACQSMFAGENTGLKRCGQTEYEDYLRTQDPLYDQIKENAMKVVQAKMEAMESARLNGNTEVYANYMIPIVVHVIYKTAAENVSDAKVIAAVAQLNMDWARTNTDAGNTPAVWQSISVNTQIQFCLAKKDPSGATTTGIVHKQTSTTSFTTNSNMKQSSTGGDDPWNVNNYFNIWSCNLSGGILGFANFPPISSVYGTVVHYCTVGSLTSPGTCAPFQYGRTLSHEIGHNWSLQHIWDGGCPAAGDGVADTPGQSGPTSGCPTWPQLDACQTASPGFMYCNYMDYTDDACYNMFTAGQKTKSQAAIASYIMSVVNYATTACGPTAVENISLDENISLYPNPSTGELFITIDHPSVSSAEVSIFNALGEAVLEKKVNIPGSRTAKLDMNDKPEGMYLVRMKTNEGTVTRKVVINR